MKKKTFTLIAFSALFFAGVQAQNLSIVKNINSTSGSDIGRFTMFNGEGYFNANDGVNGFELWKTDGTPSGTVMLKDINPNGDSNASELTPIGNKMYFAADNGTNGSEVWTSTPPL